MWQREKHDTATPNEAPQTPPKELAWSRKDALAGRIDETRQGERASEDTNVLTTLGEHGTC
jgi:hypothetical protein